MTNPAPSGVFYCRNGAFSKVIPKRWQNLPVFDSFWQFLPVFGNFQTREKFQKFHTRETIKHRKKRTQTMKITPQNTYQSEGRPKALIRRRSQVRILACPSRFASCFAVRNVFLFLSFCESSATSQVEYISGTMDAKRGECKS